MQKRPFAFVVAGLVSVEAAALAGARTAGPHAQPEGRAYVQTQAAAGAATASPRRALIDRYCVGCHNLRTKSGNLALDAADVDNVGQQPQIWEKTIRNFVERLEWFIGDGPEFAPFSERPFGKYRLDLG